VDKVRFNKLVKDYSQVASQVEELEQLIQEYPYSHPIRLLNVKSSSKLPKKAYQNKIATAAFYSTDRNVLRSLIEKGKVPSDFNPVTAKKATANRQPVKPIKSTEPRPEVKTEEKKTEISNRTPIDAEHLRQEVMDNLALLQETKAKFIKLADLEDVAQKNTKAPSPVTPKATKKKTVEAPKEEIKVSVTTKKKSTPSDKSPRAKKNELIDKFIATEPRITPGQALKDNQSDLSKASSELKEDLVSENLAIIFAKQGKTSKAIDIYKKLIWKFPQKKTSFAARIEELKKK